MKRVIANLKKLRTEKGVSQQQLANAIGVSQQSVNKYENHNVEPDISSLILMADFFHTSVDYLIGRTENSRPIEPMRRFDLNSKEEKLVTSYRQLSTEEQKVIAELLRVMAENGKPPIYHGR